MAKPSTQRDLQAEARRAQLLDTALTLFAERGVENVSMKDLANQAEIAQGLIYYYFKSKDELLTAVFQRYNPLPEFEVMIEAISDLPAREGLLRFAEGLAVLLPQKRLVVRLLIRELLSPRSTLLAQVLSLREDVMTKLTAYIEERIAAGELRPHSTQITIQLLISSFLTLLLLDQPLEPLIPEIIETILSGIRAG